MKLQAENPVVDFFLIKACKDIIRGHCSTNTDSMTVSIYVQININNQIHNSWIFIF